MVGTILIVVVLFVNTDSLKGIGRLVAEGGIYSAMIAVIGISSVRGRMQKGSRIGYWITM